MAAPNGWLHRQKQALAGNCQKAKKASGVNPIKSGEPPRFCSSGSGVGQVLQDGLSFAFICYCICE